MFARMISLPPLHPRPLLTVVGKYSRGSPMEKLGKYQGNSISGLNSTSSRSLLFRFLSLCISVIQELDMYIYEELESRYLVKKFEIFPRIISRFDPSCRKIKGMLSFHTFKSSYPFTPPYHSYIVIFILFAYSLFERFIYDLYSK